MRKKEKWPPRLTKTEISAIMRGMPNVSNLKAVVKYLCGDFIKGGQFRDVYALKACPEGYVVKIERDMSKANFANVSEWRNYINYEYSPLGNLFCPIEGIERTGQVMIMRRATILTRADKPKLPKELPAAITDTKIVNFGWLDGELVIVDYSFIIADQNNRKVRWRVDGAN